MATDTDNSTNDGTTDLEIETVDPDADTDDETVEIDVPDMHWLSLDTETSKDMKGGAKRHIFEPDPNGGYSAVCGNKYAPSHLKGTHLDAYHLTELLLDPLNLCKSCQKSTGITMDLLDLDALQDYAQNDYDATYVVDREEVQAALRDDRIPVRLSADLEIELPRSSEDTLLHILSKVPGLLDRVQNIDENETIVVEHPDDD